MYGLFLRLPWLYLSTIPRCNAGVSASNIVDAFSILFFKMKNIGAVSLKLLMTDRNASKFLFMSGFQDPSYSNFVLFRKVIYYCDLLWFLYLSLTLVKQ